MKTATFLMLGILPMLASCHKADFDGGSRSEANGENKRPPVGNDDAIVDANKNPAPSPTPQTPVSTTNAGYPPVTPITDASNGAVNPAVLNDTAQSNPNIRQIVDSLLPTLQTTSGSTVDPAGLLLAQGSVTPLVLDLNQDGRIELRSANEGVNFDIKGDGSKPRLGWIGASDGILCIDLDRDGLITSGRELFGSASRHPLTQLPADQGFTALSWLDANQDGRIDARDPLWPRLSVWVDTNGNGISEKSELHPLSHYAITALHLDWAKAPLADGTADAFVGLTGKYSTQDGRDHLLADVFFRLDLLAMRK